MFRHRMSPLTLYIGQVTGFVDPIKRSEMVAAVCGTSGLRQLLFGDCEWRTPTAILRLKQGVHPGIVESVFGSIVLPILQLGVQER